MNSKQLDDVPRLVKNRLMFGKAEFSELRQLVGANISKNELMGKLKMLAEGDDIEIWVTKMSNGKGGFRKEYWCKLK
jgi:hypothetical protein